MVEIINERRENVAKRTARMTDRQRVEALLKRQKPDRVPNWPFAAMGFTSLYTGLTIVDAYTKPEKTLNAQRQTAQDFGWVFLPMIGYAAMGGWEFGGEVKMPGGEWAQAPSVIRHAAQTPEEAMKLKGTPEPGRTITGGV